MSYFSFGIAVDDLTIAENSPANISSYSDFNWDYIYRYKGSTAVAIDENWLLTAAHVADDGGNSNLSINGVDYQQVEIVFHDSSFDPDNTSTADLALIRYDKAFPGHYPIHRWNNLSYSSGTLLLVGWGKTGTVYNTYFENGPSGQGVKRWGTNRANQTNISGQSGSLETQLFKMNFTLSNTPYEGAGVDLDSGGGVFLKYRGIWNLVGSLLYVQPYGDNFNGNYAAQLPAYYNWIEDVVLDSDGDGISDYNEENDYLTDINSADSDNDGISDGDEVYVYATDPNNSDSDADGLPDGFEISYGDGFSMEPEEDIDGDGATNYEEWIADTIPTNAISRLHILNTLNPLLLEFTSSSNREYQIQYSTNLTRDFWITYNWIDTNTWITGEHPTTSVNIPTNTYNRINRVKARLP